MKYKEALDWLYGLQAIGIKLGLKNMKDLCKLLDNPQKKFKSIHIAGTNGKGSTAAFLLSTMQCEGLKCGLTTSPHLVDITERIQINDQFIPKKRLHNLIEKVITVLAEYNKGKKDKLSPTFFEVIIAISFLYFAEEKVDIAIIETGLGGRLDSTNVLLPVVSVITNVSLEHTQYLGNTIRKIAKEKGGIIKKRVEVVSSVDQPEAIEVLQKLSSKKDSKLHLFGRDFKCEQRGKSIEYNESGKKQRFQIGLKGKHQLKNSALAIKTIDILNNNGIKISTKSLKEGLKSVKWPGRLELFEHQPTTWLVDCAHNPAAMLELSDFLNKHYKYKKIIAVFAAMKDKQYDKMLSTLEPHLSKVIFTQPKIDRAEEPDRFMQLSSVDNRVKRKSVRSALNLAAKEEHDYDLVLVTGSIFLVGESYNFIKGHTA